jgi:hypothetical protein
MTNMFGAALAGSALALILASATPAQASQDNPQALAAAADTSGLHDFDFEVGTWRVHHRVKRPTDSHAWLELESTCSNRPLMGGWANVEEHRFERPGGITYGVALRSYDPRTAQWAIWWVDGRDPHAAVDPPVKGRFEHGVGTFYSDGMVDGKPIRTRYTWSRITPTSARWEQAYSPDAGKTWETNWIMEFQRTS